MQEKKFYYNFTRLIVNSILIICALILVGCFFSTSELHHKETEVPTVEIKPYQMALLDDGSREYYFDLKDFDSRYSAILFYTSHQSVLAYNAGKQVYSFTRTGGIWGSTVGSNYNFISVNEKMLNVAIKIKPIYEVVDGQVPIFYVGAANQMYDDLIEHSLPNFSASVLIVIFSIIVFVYYSIMHTRLHLGKELEYLGYFALFVGIWSLEETDVMCLVFDNKIFDSLIPYFCLMLVIPPFVMFFDSYLGINSKYVKNILLLASLTEFFVFTILHFTKISEYRENLLYIQLMLLAACVYVTGAIIVQLIHRDFSRQVKICAIGLGLFLMALAVDLKNYYSKIGDADTYGRYTFLIFVVLFGWDLIKGTNEIIEKGRHAKQLEIFALTDSMTGLYNRNAFESHADSEHQLNGLIAVVADANGLKACNDTYGHEAGDEYITIVAEIFNSVFGRYGNCYRTGGDEFCCIIPANRAANMERLHKLFLTKVYTANLEGEHPYTIGVAIGSAEFDAAVDSDLRALIKRADASMYENKKASKSS